MIHPLWRQRWAGALAAGIGVWAAWLLAEGNYALPALLAAIAAGALVVRLTGVALDSLVLAALLFGYIVGNRGFAQLMPVPGLPLLPAEIGLALAGGWMLFQAARRREVPFQRDALHAAVFVWLLVGTARVGFDVRIHGFLALRDYAMTYYAGFFLIAHHLAREPANRRFLLGALVVISLFQPVAKLAIELFPDVVYGALSVRGVPLILMKGDLALTFLAVSALLVAFLTPRSARRWSWPLATLGLLSVLGADSRASILGALAALGWLLLSRERRFVGVQAGALLAAALVIAALALVADHDGSRQRWDGLRERTASLGDLVGTRTYASEEGTMKGENNRFRTLWWSTVTSEAWEQNPVFGLGFGHDLARGFLQHYNPGLGEEFNVRSPHSILVTTFGRLGLAGLLSLGAVLVVMARRTFAAMRRPETSAPTLGLWAATWVILVSACFGVVLEGPMGAVAFWSLLGLAATPEPRS